MKLIDRVQRHARLTAQATVQDPDSPPFLVLFINSICNMKCEHCFYWTALNKKDDMTKEELFALSDSLGPIETCPPCRKPRVCHLPPSRACMDQVHFRAVAPAQREL